MSNAFVESTFAAAWRLLKNARVAQENALMFAIQQYEAGDSGRRARSQFLFWDGRRSRYLREALGERARVKALRRRLASMSLADTLPVPPESETRRTA